MSFLLILIGLVGLYFGGEWLVRYASALARRLGLSPLVIGLTVVAFGTSAPELAATLTAALRGTPEIALGNVVGSNIANIGLVLALAALVAPIHATTPFLRREMPFMILVGVVLFPLLWDGRVGALEGAFLIAALIIYLLWLFRRGEPVDTEAAPDSDSPLTPLWVCGLGILGGLVGLVLGAQALVSGAVTIASALGVPERVIGLTLVAVGTSLPELASSLIAAFKRQGDLILGNVVGSNIFNVLAILGVSSLVTPLSVPLSGVTVDLLVMLGFSLAVVPFLATGLRLVRWEGAVLGLLYFAYIAYLFV